MKCPHCNKPFHMPTAVYRNAESYGGRVSHVRCVYCAKAVKVESKVTVTATVIGVGDPDKLEAWL